MDFVRFYGSVFREAFRHSLNLTQAVLFVLLFLAGLIVYRYPAAKTTVEALELNGWHVTGSVFGSIVAIRIVLAPYWLWKASQARIVNAPQETIDYGLRLEGFQSLIDKKNKAVQVGFILRNTSDAPIKYEVEDILVTLNGVGNDKPAFDNMGSVASRHTTTTFYYAWIFKAPIKPGTPGVASITFKYGIAGKQFTRRARYVCNIVIEKTMTRYQILEESEETI